jgi:cytochrome c biogenesis protein CcmG, thiol:disulfide interchange protein DsbE
MAIFSSRHRWHRGAAATAVRYLQCWTAALLLAGWCSLACAATEGRTAPTIEAKLLDGTSFNLADDAGKVVIVSMWATWCAPCREEMPALDAYYRQHRDQGLVLIALSMDDPKDDAKVREVTKTYSFPVGLARDADMPGYGRIWRLPLTFVVDRKGILSKDQWYGNPGLDAQLLEQTVTPLLRTP